MTAIYNVIVTGRTHKNVDYGTIDESIDDLEKALAYAQTYYRKHENWVTGDKLIAIWEIDIDKNKCREIYGRDSLIRKLDRMQEEEIEANREDEVYGSYPDQHRLRTHELVEVPS